MRRYATLLALCLAPQLLWCQDSGFNKPSLPPSAGDSLVKFSHKGSYQLLERPVGDIYEFSPYDPLRIKPAGTARIPVFHARIGTQFPLMPSLALGFDKAFSDKFNLALSLRHDSFLGGVPAACSQVAIGERSMTNDIQANLGYAWNEGAFSFGLKYGYDRNAFNSYDNSLDEVHSLGAFGLHAGIRSTKADENNLYYEFNVDYGSLHSTAANSLQSGVSLTENSVDISGYVGTTFEVHRLYVDIDMMITSYSEIKQYTAMIVELTPFYEYKNSRFKGKFGVKFGNRFGMMEKGKVTKMPDGNDISAVSTVFPNVDARVEIVRRALWARLLVGGGYDMNSYSDLVKDCNLLAPDTDLRMGCRPVDASLTLESVVLGRFAVNLSGGFRMTRNKPIFSPVVDGRAMAEAGMYEVRAWDIDVNTFTAAAEAFWKSESFTIGGEFRYNRYWSDDVVDVTQLPKFTGHAYMRYNWRERISVSADFNYLSRTSGDRWGAYEVPAITDLGLKVGYALNSKVSFYVKCGNMLNSGNEYVPLRLAPGRNFGGGVSFSL